MSTDIKASESTTANAVCQTSAFGQAHFPSPHFRQRICALWILLLFLMLPSIAKAQLSYTTNNGSITITGYTGLDVDISIPDMIEGLPVTSIGAFAFSGCSALSSITISGTVTNIGEYAFLTGPGGGIYGVAASTNLTTITVAPDNPNYSSLEGVLFNKSQTTLLQYPPGKAETSYTLLPVVTSIGHHAFYGCNRLANITMSSGLTQVGDDAFSFCTSLTNLVLPDSVSSIGVRAFYECASLTAVTLPDTLTSISDAAFYGCSSLTNVPIPSSVVSVGDSAFCLCPSLANVMIPSSVTNLGTYAFAASTSLSSITIPDSVTSISSYTFAWCTGLTSVTISDSVTRISNSAFASCTGLSSITIPGSLNYLGEGAFWWCTNLAGVYFKGNVCQYDGDVFPIATNAIVFYLPGATGWSTTFSGRPTLLWNPQVQTSDGSFGVQSNQFGFKVSGTTNIPVVVETCTHLANPVWSPVATNVLATGSYYFTDPQWTNYSTRLYRLRWP